MVVRQSEELQEIISREAAANDIDADLLEAISIQEGGQNGAVVNRLPDKIHLDTATKNGSRKYSYGLMQIQYARAVDALKANGEDPNVVLGPLEPGNPHDLLQDPTTLTNEEENIRIAAMAVAQHRQQCGRGDTPESAACLAAGYNAAAPIRQKNNSSLYINQKYVNDVLMKTAGIKGQASFAQSAQDSGASIPVEDKVSFPNQQSHPTPPPDGGGDEQSVEVCRFYKESYERIDPYPLPPNPFHSTFYVNIGGRIEQQGGPVVGGVTLTPVRPQYIQYFEYYDPIGPGNDSFRIRFFDPNWDVVETKTLRGANESAMFSPNSFANAFLYWGYTGGANSTADSGAVSLMSGLRQCRLLRFHPSFLGFGVEIEIEGVGDISGIQRLVQCGNDTWPNEEMISQGKTSISDIVREIAIKKLKIPEERLCIYPTIPFYEPSRSGEQSTAHPRQYVRSDIDYLTFIERFLIPSATDGKGHNDYRLYLDNNAGEPILHFHPWLNNMPIREYSYSRQRTGAIISFRPEVNAQALIAAAGIVNTGDTTDNPDPPSLKVRGTNTYTGLSYDEGVNAESMTGRDVTGELEPTPYLDRFHKLTDLDRVGCRSFNSPYTNKEEELARMRNIYQSASLFAIRGELTVIGDPLIKPNRQIRLIVFRHDGHHHMTSGIYRIQAVRHVIQSGNYTSSLELFRTDPGLSTGQYDEQGNEVEFHIPDPFTGVRDAEDAGAKVSKYAQVQYD